MKVGHSPSACLRNVVAIYGLIMAIVFSSKLKASKTPDADQNYYTGELERV